jgi:hypothetical protein
MLVQPPTNRGLSIDTKTMIGHRGLEGLNVTNKIQREKKKTTTFFNTSSTKECEFSLTEEATNHDTCASETL